MSTPVPIEPPLAPIPAYTPVGLWVPEPEPPLPADLQEPEPAPAPKPAPAVVVVQRTAPRQQPIRRRVAPKPAPQPLTGDLAYMSESVRRYLSTLSPDEQQRVIRDLKDGSR